MSTCNQLGLETLGSWPITPKSLPGHQFQSKREMGGGWVDITKFEVYMLGNMACWVLFVAIDETSITLYLFMEFLKKNPRLSLAV